MLAAAMLTTAVVGVVAVSPGGDPVESQAVADAADPSSPTWLRDGLDTLHERLRSVRDDVRKHTTDEPDSAKSADLPANSGRGRRVVFDISGQRVWLVGDGGNAFDTYLVSGSTSNNLKPGRYRVFSRSRHAVGFDQHSTMEYFVRFARGENSNIGFHDVPVDSNGKRVQSVDELGTPRSAGCIRQKRADAKRMWRFADTGTRVVVVA